MSTLLVGLFLLGSVRPAGAIPITWTLENVSLNDGTTATGSFLYDADGAMFYKVLSWDIHVSDGFLSRFDYKDTLPSHSAHGGYTNPDAVNFGWNVGSSSSDRILVLYLEAPLTNAGGAVGIAPWIRDGTATRYSRESYYRSMSLSYRYVEPGGILQSTTAPVPEPMSVLFLGSGLSGLAGVRLVRYLRSRRARLG